MTSHFVRENQGQKLHVAPIFTMLNRVSNTFADTDRGTGVGSRSWKVDGNPNVRLAWLGVLFVMPLVATLSRLIQVQQVLPASIVATYTQKTTTTEPIASRDGRILAVDGRVLAYDIERYDIHAHYRWIEEPADDDWLKHRALSQLDRTDRRDSSRVTRETESVRKQRDAMWNRLEKIAGVSAADLDEARRLVQQRVERIIDRVESRREQIRNDLEPLPAADVDSQRGDGWWQTVSRRVIATLTTPPRRGIREPVVIQEELDYHPILEDVSHEVAAEVESHPELYPGLRVRSSTQRIYPERDVAPHLIGSRLTIAAEQLAARKEQFPDGDPLDYRPGDRIGRTGVERSYNRYLRGLRGERRITRNRRGEVVDTTIVRPPTIGRDIVLTLNLPLQERFESMLDAAIQPSGKETADNGETKTQANHGGAIVAIDVHTGEVLAAASAPRFDLNLLVSANPEEWRAVMDDARRPMFARPTQMTLPPGSVFKALTAVALMESGRFDPDAHVFCQGYLDNPNRHRCYIYRHFGVGHAELDLTDALARSCNVYFFSGARTVGPEPIIDWARRFGFGQPTGIDLPGERGGNLPIPPDMLDESPNRRKRTPWYPGDTLGLAIGQSRLTVTPIQIARMMATIANGGYFVTPHVVRSFGPAIDEGQGNPKFPNPPQRRRVKGLSEATLSRVREGLEKVVAHPRGTGYKHVRLKQIAIAGKTGTAEAGGSQGDHAWFAGYVPAHRPQVAFVVVLEHAGSGGSQAGPVARQLVEAMLELSVIESSRTAMR